MRAGYELKSRGQLWYLTAHSLQQKDARETCSWRRNYSPTFFHRVSVLPQSRQPGNEVDLQPPIIIRRVRFVAENKMQTKLPSIWPEISMSTSSPLSNMDPLSFCLIPRHCSSIGEKAGKQQWFPCMETRQAFQNHCNLTVHQGVPLAPISGIIKSEMGPPPFLPPNLFINKAFSWLLPLFHNEPLWKPGFSHKNEFDLCENECARETHFNMNGLILTLQRLVLGTTWKTWKWPIPVRRPLTPWPPKILKKNKETKTSYGKQIYCETLCHSFKIPEIAIAGTIPCIHCLFYIMHSEHIHRNIIIHHSSSVIAQFIVTLHSGKIPDFVISFPSEYVGLDAFELCYSSYSIIIQ